MTKGTGLEHKQKKDEEKENSTGRYGTFCIFDVAVIVVRLRKNLLAIIPTVSKMLLPLLSRESHVASPILREICFG